MTFLWGVYSFRHHSHFFIITLRRSRGVTFLSRLCFFALSECATEGNGGSRALATAVVFIGETRSVTMLKGSTDIG